MGKRLLQKTIRKTWKFLASPRTKEFLVFLFFLVLSTVFWLLQALDETHENHVRIKVELVNIPQDVVITSELPEEINVLISDKGTTFWHYWRDELPVMRVSFPNYDTGAASGHVCLKSNDILPLLQECLLSTTKVLAIQPDTLDLFYNHGLHKTVPVKVLGEVKAAANHYLCDVVPSPSQVTVYASAAVLDTLTAVYTRPVRMEELRSDTSCVVELYAIRGAKYNTKRVRVKASVDAFMEMTDTVSIITTNFPADVQLRTFPTNVMVTYTMGYRQKQKLPKGSLVIQLTYDQILKYQQEGKSRIPLTLKNIPDDVVNVRIEPSEIDYLLEKTEEEE